MQAKNTAGHHALVGVPRHAIQLPRLPGPAGGATRLAQTSDSKGGVMLPDSSAPYAWEVVTRGCKASARPGVATPDAGEYASRTRRLCTIYNRVTSPLRRRACHQTKAGRGAAGQLLHLHLLRISQSV